MDWLDELGLDVPVSLEDYRSVLASFKEGKPGAVPLVLSSLAHMNVIAGAFGIPMCTSPDFMVVDGKVEYPFVTDRAKGFIDYMHGLYADGLVDPEFMIDKEAMQKMIAGQGGMMLMNNVEIVRQMPAFLEKNPDGRLEYIAPPVGEGGAQGYVRQALTSQNWIVPATSKDKANECIDFLNKANASQALVDMICLGEDGTHHEMADGRPQRLDAFGEIGYKGYYSRLIVDNTWDDYANMLEGFDVPVAFLQPYTKDNDILFAPIDVPASGGRLAELRIEMSNQIIEMIVNGYSDGAWDKIQAAFRQYGGDELKAEYQAWYESR
jgi:ABC-type glycerol-3-phosphate transport system substrate-binding protein